MEPHTNPSAIGIDIFVDVKGWTQHNARRVGDELNVSADQVLARFGLGPTDARKTLWPIEPSGFGARHHLVILSIEVDDAAVLLGEQLEKNLQVPVAQLGLRIPQIVHYEIKLRAGIAKTPKPLSGIERLALQIMNRPEEVKRIARELSAW